MPQTSVLIVDDSPAICRLLAEVLSRDPAIHVCGTAGDPFEARDKIKALSPDVITLDIEMPRMDGLTFLENLMRLRPMPVVMCSNLTSKDAKATLRAFELGAVDFINKTQMLQDAKRGDTAEDIAAIIKAAARANLRRASLVRAASSPTHTVAPETLPEPVPSPVAKAAPATLKPTRDIIAIGSSTGGTEAVKEILSKLPPTLPGIVIAQHIPAAFSGSFADRMNRSTELTVKQAEDGEVIHQVCVYIAPGGHHLEVLRRQGHLVCRVYEGERVNRHMPSVEVLFDSVTAIANRRTISIMLTGMGKDGAEGMKRLHDAGARTIAQDEATSTVFGMPAAAIELGAADHVLPLQSIAQRILELTYNGEMCLIKNGPEAPTVSATS
ncbi:MAG: chemotaxis response regulator protein-glutamate methylesterase [Pseudomonadota bacterium]